MRLEYTTVSATGPERRRQTTSIRRCNLLGQAARRLSVRMLPILSRNSDTPNGFWIKCQAGSIVSPSGEYPDIRTTLISRCAWDNCAAISIPFILPGITTSETRRSIGSWCSLATFNAWAASFASRKAASTDPFRATWTSLRTISSSSTIRMVIGISSLYFDRLQMNPNILTISGLDVLVREASKRCQQAQQDLQYHH